MDKKIVGLVGAISGLMSLSTAQATAVPPTETALPSAQSFGELLDPIPNAAALLRAASKRGWTRPAPSASRPDPRPTL
jgi:hypothetical protein